MKLKAEINCAEDSGWVLGYTALNERADLRVHEWQRCFCCTKSLCFACLLKAYNKLRDTTGSIGVVMHLIVMIESMVTQFNEKGLATVHIIK